MNSLASEADNVVRAAVEHYLAGSSPITVRGEIEFETRNSVYRLVDGVIFDATDTAIIGSELVGWLLEGSGRCLVQSTWVAGARAVLLVRNGPRHIVITSACRAYRRDHSGARAGSTAHQAGSAGPQNNARGPMLGMPPLRAVASNGQRIPACPPPPPRIHAPPRPAAIENVRPLPPPMAPPRRAGGLR